MIVEHIGSDIVACGTANDERSKPVTPMMVHHPKLHVPEGLCVSQHIGLQCQVAHKHHAAELLDHESL